MLYYNKKIVKKMFDKLENKYNKLKNYKKFIGLYNEMGYIIKEIDSNENMNFFYKVYMEKILDINIDYNYKENWYIVLIVNRINSFEYKLLNKSECEIIE